jgi:hypothetical protein
VVEIAMKIYASLFLVALLSACFHAPGDTCTSDEDCLGGKSCVALETRSVCISTGIADAGQALASDAANTSDAGSRSDADSPDVVLDAGSALPDTSAAVTDAGETPETDRGRIASLGAAHSCSVSSEGGALKCWGANGSLQLGLAIGSSGDRFVPVAASGTGAATPEHLAAGAEFTCASFSDQVWCWGKNPFSEIVLDRPWLLPLPEPLAIRQLAAGNSHFCALLSDGRVACAGNNDIAQIGQAIGSANDGNLQIVNGLSGVHEIVLGGDQSCALLQNGAVSCWGKTPNHRETQGEDSGALRQVEGFGSVISLTVGAGQICAVDENFVPRCLGDNTFKQINDDLRLQLPMTELAPLGIGLTYTALHASQRQTCALASDGTVFCWGQIEDGPDPSPTLVPGLSTVVRLIPGAMANHHCAELENGELYCWGRDEQGQLGRGRYLAGGYLSSAGAVDLISTAVGSDEAPGSSCRQIHEQHPELRSGRYLLNPDEGQPVEAYCDMQRGEGGWTLLVTLPATDDVQTPTAAYGGTLWNNSFTPVSLPADFSVNVTAYRSPLYARLSYANLSLGMRIDAEENWRYWAFWDGPRASMGAVIGSDDFVAFGSAGADSSPETGWCSLFDAPCGWSFSGDDRAGYNSLYNGVGVRIGISARQDQPSCAGPVPAYVGLGGSTGGVVSGIHRSYASVRNSNCQNNNHTQRAAGQVWVR